MVHRVWQGNGYVWYTECDRVMVMCGTQCVAGLQYCVLQSGTVCDMVKALCGIQCVAW